MLKQTAQTVYRGLMNLNTLNSLQPNFLENTSEHFTL